MKISLVGLAPLHMLGLCSFINKEFQSVECIEAAESDEWKSADRFIVSAASLAGDAPFFMPRLARLLLISSSPQPKGKSIIPLLSPLADRKEIREAIRQLIQPKPNPEFSHPGHPHASASPHSGMGGTKPDPRVNLLSEREKDVLRLTAKGLQAKQIASCLGITTGTVSTHRRNLSDKIGVHGAPSLVYFAMTNGLV